MSFIKPFCGLRPKPSFIEQVVAPPYDVVDYDEAKSFVANKPYNFLYLSKPEISANNPKQDIAYLCKQGQENWLNFLNKNIFITDTTPNFYVYRLTSNNCQQTGFFALVATKAYKSGFLKRHELTRDAKLLERVSLLSAQKAHISPILCMHKPNYNIKELLAKATNCEQSYSVKLGSVQHDFWVPTDSNWHECMQAAVDELSELYIADGHHRASASLAVAEEFAKNKQAACILAGIFPEDTMKILGYHRVIADLNGMNEMAFLAQLERFFNVELADNAVKPSQHGDYGLFILGQWYKLTARLQYSNTLDSDFLTKHVLNSLLDIKDLRSDPRIDFIGGENAQEKIVNIVNSKSWRLGFTLAPVTTTEIIKLADNNAIMPPKTTWFEPKLLDGFVSYSFDGLIS